MSARQPLQVPRRTMDQLLDLGMVRYSRLRHKYFDVETGAELQVFTLIPPGATHNRAERRAYGRIRRSGPLRSDSA
jgi:hypothetical protein